MFPVRAYVIKRSLDNVRIC